ncbi:MAG: CocE/NonD family hydrolase, partial [Kordiimonas sp.]
QQLIITPFNHGGSRDADPFKVVDLAPEPSFAEQYGERIAFLDTYLKADDPAPLNRQIRYYTMVEDVWKTTDVWPPKGFETERWYFGENNSLTTAAPVRGFAQDSYKVDFSATTGVHNRWLANLGGGRDIVYPDRSEEDAKLLVYDTPALTQDMEITGVPVVTLQVESTHEDGAFHVYLEDVAPNGRVTYITEGILQAKHRKVSEDTPPFYTGGPYHSFKAADAESLIVGKVSEIKIGLINTSVLIKAGHRLRVAVAGHDASVFERVPAKGTPTITLHRNRNAVSYIDLPVMRRQH